MEDRFTTEDQTYHIVIFMISSICLLLLLLLLLLREVQGRNHDVMPVHFDAATPEQVRNEFNFFGLINVKNVVQKEGLICGSTLIAENIIVTAAHCLEPILESSKRKDCMNTELQCIEASFDPNSSPWELEIVFRQRERESKSNDIAKYNAGRIFVHKDWMKVKYPNDEQDAKSGTARHDIAIIFITGSNQNPIENLGLSPAALGTVVPNQGEEIKSFGWGMREKMFYQSMGCVGCAVRRPVERSPYVSAISLSLSLSSLTHSITHSKGTIQTHF